MITISLNHSLKLKSMILPAFFLNIIFRLNLFCFHTNFQVIYFISVEEKKAIGVLTRIRVYLYIALSSIDILIIFLKSYGYRVSFHLFVMSSISFISQKRQNDLCWFPGQIIQYHGNPSLCPD